MRVLAIANQKGGVGKTTTTVNLGASLAERGHSCLVIDLDPQGNLTTGLDLEMNETTYSIYDSVVDGEPLRNSILKTKVENLHAVPSDPSLAGADLEVAADEPDPERRARRLAGLLAGLADGEPRYDYVLVDCPPSLGLFTVNALVAARGVVVPLQCEFFAMQGLARLLTTVDTIRRHWNPKLEILGIVFTMVDRRTRLSQQVISEVRRRFGERVFRSQVPRSVRLAEASSFGLPVQTYDPRSVGAAAYSELAAEVLAR